MVKRFFHLVILFTILLSASKLYAADLDDLLRGLESPEVNYHVDEEIKTIVIPPKPVIKTAEKPSTQGNEKNSEKSQVTTKEKNVTDVNKDSLTSKNSDKNTKAITASNSANLMGSLGSLAQKLKKANNSDKLTKKKSDKPVKIYSLFTFFKNMAFVKTWSDNIVNNLAFCKILTDDIFDFWQQKVEEEEEEENEEEEELEEEAPIDFSKYATQLAQAQSFCDEGKWDEVSRIFEENPEAAEAPEAQKCLLLVELNNPKVNINRLRSLGNTVLEEDPNDPYANYALAIFHFKTKKKDIKKASQHIAVALKSKNPPKGALELSKEINSSGFAIYIIIALIIAAIAGATVFIIKKKKAKSLNAGETASSETPADSALPEGETPKEDSKLAQKLAQIKAKLEPVLTKLRPILEKLKPLFEKIKEAIINALNKIKNKKQHQASLSNLPGNNASQPQEEVEEIIVEVDEDGNEIIVEEVIDDGTEGDITEEIIEEEIIEGSDPSSSGQEIVEEHIIEEVEEDTSEEEIVEEVIEEEEEEEIEDKGTSEISEESLLKE